MVKAWREDLVIPTYEIGEAEKNPIFLEKRVYQGSSGVVYPYPVVEKIGDEPVDHTWHAVWIENEYIKVMILPELGGRVHYAYDKIKGRPFVYHNHVIKPALVGLTGPWISGGIEFNWPQHHRPSTYLPIDCDIEENADGSVTVWVNEYERMFHQKGAAGFTLRPGCAYLEIKGQLYNGTCLPQTFLWWANPAVAVNDHYQSVFPQDINAVFDHGKRAVSSFPIATGTYYKMDYSAGVDISNYKNIKVPTSYMGINSKYNFEGGYENDSRGGMLHVANHHLSPGKKQWTWGNGDFGRAWDRNLTDADGPYIELMAGVFTENQPDFSWLMPYEEKRFVQYFMPYRDLGIVKNATKDLVMNIESKDGIATLMLFATSRQRVRVILRNDNGTVYFDEVRELGPESVFRENIDVHGTPTDRLSLVVKQGADCPAFIRHTPLLTWHAEPDEIRPIPDPAEAALLPHEIKTNEQLYLTGLHLEQYRHATYNPVDYYEEGLRRDPLDYRCNNALGLWYLRKGRFDKAESYLRTAVAVLKKRNPNPYDGEPLFNLALTLRFRSRYDEAYRLFWKSTWNAAWQDAGFFECARISVRQHRLYDALEEIDSCLVRNAHNIKALALKTTILRLLDRKDEALRLARESLKADLFNYGCLFETYLLTSDEMVLRRFENLLHGEPNNYLELAIDYWSAGLNDVALQVLDRADAVHAAGPMTYYYMGLCGRSADFDRGRQACPDYCFPNRLEDILALQAALLFNRSDDHANYYLGCLYYANRQYDVACHYWEESARLNPTFPTVWRNLALAAYNKAHRVDEAVEYMERAFNLNTDDARVFMELDQLYKRLGRRHEERLKLYARHDDLVVRRDDLLLEKITLLNQTGHYAEAMRLLDSHRFHPWEGGEGKVSGQYQFSRKELAKVALEQCRWAEAVELLEQCLVYPHHLGEGRLENAQENDVYYLLGCAYEGLGDGTRAYECWQKATQGPQEPAAAIYYNDAQPDKIYYQGLALLRLGRRDEANGRFYKLVDYGQKHLFDHVVMDYFAVSLPDLQIWEGDLDLQNEIHCKYMLALGYDGLGDAKHAHRYLEEARTADINHLGILALGTLKERKL